MSPNPLNDDASLKRLLAFIAVIWAMLIMTAVLVVQVAFSIKSISWTPPESIVHICEAAIFSAVLILGGTTSAFIRGYLAKKDEKEKP